MSATTETRSETTFFPSRQRMERLEGKSVVVLDVDEATGRPRLVAVVPVAPEMRNGLFVANNPVNTVDPLGLWGINDCWSTPFPPHDPLNIPDPHPPGTPGDTPKAGGKGGTRAWDHSPGNSGNGYRTMIGWGDGSSSTIRPESLSAFESTLGSLSGGRGGIDSLEIEGHGGTAAGEALTTNNIERLTNILAPLLNANSNVYLDGCRTANWAKSLSTSLSNSNITGNRNDVWGWKSTGPVIGNGPIWKQKETYRNGELVP